MRRMRSITFGLSLVLCGSGLLLTGCTGTTKAGTEYTQLPNRKLQADLPGSLEHVHKTAVKVLEDDLGYKIEKQANDALEGIIVARTAKEDEVRVETYKAEGDMTTVQVFVGLLAREEKAREILSMIESRLGKKAAAAEPKQK